MAYEHEWPYVEVKQNRDWLLKQLDDLKNRLDGLVEEAVKLSKEYTDEQLANYQAQVEAIRVEFTALVNSLDNDFVNLRNQVNTSLLQMDLKISALEDLIAAQTVAINHRTDLAIEQNNAYILSEVSKFLSGIEVYNVLTGEYVTIQDMFNFLCSLHVDNPITYDELAARNITYDELAALHITYTQLAMNGGSLIPEE